MKKTPLLPVLTLLSFIFLLTSCEEFYFNCLKGNGIMVSQEREPGQFSGVINSNK
jgi:hypothetical protein